MSEQFNPIATKNVFAIDPAPLDPLNRKAVIAMQATALYVAGDEKFKTVNERLVEVAKEVGKPPTMTYEDVVFVNPVFDQVRVLSSETVVARNEANFYRSHRAIEGHLYSAVKKLVCLDSRPGHMEPEQAVFPVTSAGRGGTIVELTPPEELEMAVTEIIKLHKSLGRSGFAAFRSFFTGLNGYPGASGLYSETIPTLDLLVHGGVNMSQQEREQILLNYDRGLYPEQGCFGTLLKLLIQYENPKMLMPDDMREEMIRHLNAFRRVHRGSVKKLLPEVLNGSAAGSGGVANVAGFLASKVVELSKGEEND